MKKKVHNPLLPIEWHIPDPEAHVMDGKLYLYGSYDKMKAHFCSEEYYVASTVDFTEWEIDGPIFQSQAASWASTSKTHSSLSGIQSFNDLPAHIKEQLPETAKEVPIKTIIQAIEEHSKKGLPEKTLLYAPDAIKKNGKYYLYMCLSDNTEGVAIADHPEGPFGNAIQLPVEGIDPAVFVDDDGKGYYYWGQFNGHAARLDEDMMTIIPGSIVENIVTEEEHHFHEGSSIRKREEMYYYVFADTTRGKPTCLGYATSNAPFGPFKYQGIIIDNAKCDPYSWNNHGSIEEFNGQWYVFYHRSSQSSERMRRVCAEPVFFDELGQIKEVKMTSQGPGDPFEAGEKIPAYTACELIGQAYIDRYGDTEDIYVAKNSGEAVFRYLRNNKVIGWAQLEGIGTADIELWIDGVIAGNGSLQDKKISLQIFPGLHEVKLVIKDAEGVRISSLAFGE